MFLAMLAAASLWAGPAAAEKRVVVLHTNDWQSRLLPFGPNADYTVEPGDDDTIGGIARMATLVAQQRAEAEGGLGRAVYRPSRSVPRFDDSL